MRATVWAEQTSATGSDVANGKLNNPDIIQRLETTGRDLVWTLDHPRGLARLKASLSRRFRKSA